MQLVPGLRGANETMLQSRLHAGLCPVSPMCWCSGAPISWASCHFHVPCRDEMRLRVRAADHGAHSAQYWTGHLQNGSGVCLPYFKSDDQYVSLCEMRGLLFTVRALVPTVGTAGTTILLSLCIRRWVATDVYILRKWHVTNIVRWHQRPTRTWDLYSKYMNTCAQKYSVALIPSMCTSATPLDAHGTKVMHRHYMNGHFTSPSR